MTTRRHVLAGALALGVSRPGRAEPLPGDDGLYHEPWFLESFLDLPDDRTSARAHGKRLAVLWELKGCPYCKLLHVRNFSDPAVSGYIRDRFEVVQLNLIGAREVIDFDGERLSEKRFAEKYVVRSAPAVQFFRDDDADLAKERPYEREVLRLHGYSPPDDFRRAFAFVAERAYERMSLHDYLDAPGPGRKG